MSFINLVLCQLLGRLSSPFGGDVPTNNYSSHLLLSSAPFGGFRIRSKALTMATSLCVLCPLPAPSTWSLSHSVSLRFHRPIQPLLAFVPGLLCIIPLSENALLLQASLLPLFTCPFLCLHLVPEAASDGPI